MAVRLPSGCRTALVTGASSGIGEAFARALAGAGADVVLVARRRDRLERLAKELESRSGSRAEVLVADLADRTQLASVEERLQDPGRPVDLLVNNAGFGTQGLFHQLPLDRQDEEMRVNVVAPVRLAHAALAGMVSRRRGGVVNVSSLAGMLPLPYWSTYSSTKAFLTTFSLSLHEEVRRHGVTVVVVMPGFTRTEFHDHEHVKLSPVPGPAWMSADQVARAGLDALRRRRPRAFPGLRNRAIYVLCRVAPHTLSSRFVAEVGRRM